jgi:hypothetical protein
MLRIKSGHHAVPCPIPSSPSIFSKKVWKIPPSFLLETIIKWGGICFERWNLEGCRRIKKFVPWRTNGFVSGQHINSQWAEIV